MILEQSQMMKRYKFIIISFMIIIFVYIMYVFLQTRSCGNDVDQSIFVLNKDNGHQNNQLLRNHGYSVWPEYISPSSSPVWFKGNCWTVSNLSITALPEAVQDWSRASNKCRQTYKKFVAIYDVTSLKTTVVLEEPFIRKVRKWLGNNEALVKEARLQTLIKVFNLYTYENVLINPLRDKRPIVKPERPEREFVEELSSKGKASCDFCKYKDSTAQDQMERIESRHSVSAANTFKWDKHHGLILTKSHHPLKWDEEQFLDLMNTAVLWFRKVNSHDPTFKYPVVIWDLLPHASASQVHPHLHTNLNSDRYYGYVENWRFAGERYFQDTASNFFADMTEVHHAVGLSVQLRNATAIAHMVPRRDDEVIVISQHPDTDFFRLLYYTLRAFIDDMEKLTFSLAIALPPLGDDQAGVIPAYARVVTRGPVSSLRSDISSVDLFVASNVNIDPFKVISYVRKSVEKRSGPGQ